MPMVKKQESIQQEKSQAIYKTRKQLVFDNFLSGIAWGVGSGLGATLVLTLIGFILAQSQELPFIGQIIENFIYTLEQATKF